MEWYPLTRKYCSNCNKFTKQECQPFDNGQRWYFCRLCGLEKNEGKGELKSGSN